MRTILDQIVERKRADLEAIRRTVPVAELERRWANVAVPHRVREFTRALQRPGGVTVIAEVKKASPSVGVIRADIDPPELARCYQRHGAVAISVLTDEPFFQGHLDHLRAVREVVACPVLRKDFIIDRYQLLEARLAGADAVLLIAEILPGDELSRLQSEAVALGLHTLVEFYDAQNLPRVLDCGAQVIGVNNRDLRTFMVRLEHTLELAERIPSDRCLVSESGIRSPADIERLRQGGVRAVLVGESLLRADDPGRALARLVGR